MPGKKRSHSQVDALEEYRRNMIAPDPLQEAIKIAKAYVPPPGSEPTSRDLVTTLVFEYLNTHPGSELAGSNAALFSGIITVLNRERNMQVSEDEIQSLRTELLYRLRLAKRATLIASFLPGKPVCEEWQGRPPPEPLGPAARLERQKRYSSVYRAVQSVKMFPSPKCDEGFFDNKVADFLTQVFYDLNWKPSRIKQKLRQIKRTIGKSTPDHDLTQHISASAKVAALT